MITLLASSALRSLLLGVIVRAALKIFRLRDTRSETLIWTLVLAASLAMPLLVRELPGGIALPDWQNAAPLSVTTTMIAPRPGWFALHGAALLWSLYAAVALVGLLRLVAGLLLCLKLYRQAVPVLEPWAHGRNVRASGAIDAPLSLGTAILVPADCRDWPATKRLAVLAHEEAHIRRGDFFIQLLAGLHRAIFWFNPFAWWLMAHLRDLAETASDAAAIQELKDAASYAEILVEVSARAQRQKFKYQDPLMAMARGPGIARRVDHILAGVPEQAIGHAARAFAVLSVLAAAGTIAGAHAKDAPAPAALPLMRAPSAETRPLFAAAAEPAKPVPPAQSSSATHAPATAASHRSARAVARPPAESQVTYNPRALLETPDVAVVPAIVPVSGKASSSYLLNRSTYVGGN